MGSFLALKLAKLGPINEEMRQKINDIYDSNMESLSKPIYQLVMKQFWGKNANAVNAIDSSVTTPGKSKTNSADKQDTPTESSPEASKRVDEDYGNAIRQLRESIDGCLNKRLPTHTSEDVDKIFNYITNPISRIQNTNPGQQASLKTPDTAPSSAPPTDTHDSRRW